MTNAIDSGVRALARNMNEDCPGTPNDEKRPKLHILAKKSAQALEAGGRGAMLQ